MKKQFVKRISALALALALLLSVSVTAFAAGTSFVDVTKDDPYYKAVKWAEKEAVTNGADATHFVSKGTATRAQAATFLWRMAGCVEHDWGSAFSDVPAGSWYEQAVIWAQTNDITKGTGNGKFSPDAACTRAQFVTMLYRMSGTDLSEYLEMEPVELTDESSAEEWGVYMVQQYVKMIRESDEILADVPQGSWYELPVIWALMSGVANADNTPSDGLFHAGEACTRGDMISFVYQFHLYEDAQRGIYPSEEIQETTLLDTAEFNVVAHRMLRESGTTPLLDVTLINKTAKEVVFTPEVTVNGKLIEYCDFITIENDEESGITTYSTADAVEHGNAVDCYLRINDSMLEEAGITDIGEIQVKLTVTEAETGEVLAEGKEVTIKTDLYDEVMQ